MRLWAPALALLSLSQARQAPIIYPDSESLLSLSHPSGDEAALERDAYFLFNAVHHLLRQWGNTISPNGFSFTKGFIPAGITLYHARGDSHIPASPDWLAFDPEMSYAIMSGRCSTFMRTYRTTRRLNILYIDGNSASLTSSGTLDSQDILMYGYVKSRRGYFDEFERARNLCAWGTPLGIDGFVRQNSGFELIKCAFEDGLALTTNLNVTSWMRSFTPPGNSTRRFCWDRWPPDEPPSNSSNLEAFAARRSLLDAPSRPALPPFKSAVSTLVPFPSGRPRRPYGGRWPEPSPFENTVMYSWARIAAAVYDGTGEYRVKLDAGTFVTAYGRAGLNITSPNTTDHRLTNLTREAAEDIKEDIRQFFLPSSESESNQVVVETSGVDWRDVTDQIVARYGERLQELFIYLSSSGLNATNTTMVESARMLVALLLLPHYDTSADASREDNLRACTTYLVPSDFENQWPASERKIARSIQRVHGAICDTLIFVHEELEAASTRKTRLALRDAVDSSRERVSELMNSLRWTMWRSCDTKCGVGEICLIMLWPLAGWDFNNQDPPRCVNSTTWHSGRDRRRG